MKPYCREIEKRLLRTNKLFYLPDNQHPSIYIENELARFHPINAHTSVFRGLRDDFLTQANRINAVVEKTTQKEKYKPERKKFIKSFEMKQHPDVGYTFAEVRQYQEVFLDLQCKTIRGREIHKKYDFWEELGRVFSLAFATLGAIMSHNQFGNNEMLAHENTNSKLLGQKGLGLFSRTTPEQKVLDRAEKSLKKIGSLR